MSGGGKPPGYLVLGILRLLEDTGEMTRAELCAALGVPKLKCASVVSRLNRAQKSVPKRIYVIRWVYDDDTTGRHYPRSVYALGDLPDAEKPRAKTGAENGARWRANERQRCSSVFQWAQPRKVRLAQRRGAVA